MKLSFLLMRADVSLRWSGCLSSLPPPPPVFYVCVSCPSSSIQTPVYHDNSCLPRSSAVCEWPTAGCWRALSVLRPSRVIKRLAAAPAARKLTALYLLCLNCGTSSALDRLGSCSWFCQQMKREEFDFLNLVDGAGLKGRGHS